MSEYDVLRRGSAFAAFLQLVENYGTATINCDMESYGREPGDIVTIQVAASTGGYYSSYAMEFTADNVQRFAATIAPAYEADAALLTGEAAPGQPGPAEAGRE